MVSPSVRKVSNVDEFSGSARNFGSFKSLSKKSIAQQTVIKGGKKRSKQLEDRRYKLARRANFEYLDKMEEEHAKHNAE